MQRKEVSAQQFTYKFTLNSDFIIVFWKKMCIFAHKMDLFWQTPTQSILLFILYGITGAIPSLAALYLLLCPGNAIAPNVTPPVRLRRWAASFFAIAALGHVWWILFCIHHRDLHSMDSMVRSSSYIGLVVFDSVTLLTTIAGTLLAMLQDRKRPVWPAFVAMMPFVVLEVLQILYPDGNFMNIASIYFLSIYMLFSVYMVFAVRQYGRWLNDNYADLENKKVWLSHVVTLVCLLLCILYTLVDNLLFIYLLHVVELVLFGLLLWRVETLPNLISDSLTPASSPRGEESEYPQGQEQSEEQSTSLAHNVPLTLRRGVRVEAMVGGETLAQIERLLTEHCVSTQLYLQHDLTLQQLAQAVGTNRSYLSQYFSRQGITYNTYINNLRINHFISHFQEVVAAGLPFNLQQLASDSGYRSYSTFSLAFKQRTGQSVTAWMRNTSE